MTAWTDEAACVGNTALMYDPYRQPAARAVCASCPVAGICLWTAMADEADEPHPYRYGIFGGVLSAERVRLGAKLSRAAIADRLADAIAVRSGAAPRYRPLRRCAGCPALISQPRAGRPQTWCSARCKKRTESARPWLRARTAACRHCARPVPQARMGRPRHWCSGACREAERRAALSPAKRAALAAERRQRRADRRAA